MSKYEKFGVLATITGFIIDAGTLLGVIFGFIKPLPSLGLLANPFVVAIVTYFASLLFMVGLLYYLIQRAKVRWRYRRKLPRQNSSESYEGLDNLIVLLWFPIEILWSIGIVKYFYLYFYGSANFVELAKNPDFGFMLFVSFAFMVPLFLLFPGLQLPSIAKSLDDFFDPKD
jgi:hypothetical protein